MRETSTPTGSFTSLAFTAAVMAASHERGDAPVASVRRTTEAAALLGRAGIRTGTRTLRGGPPGMTVRRQTIGLHPRGGGGHPREGATTGRPAVRAPPRP